MNKTKMRTILEEMLASLDGGDDLGERPVTTAEQVLRELRESRRLIADAFRHDPAEVRASVPQADPPERKTAGAEELLRLRTLADSHDYRFQKWQGMDSTERMAAKLAAALPPDPQRDVMANSPAEIETAIGQSMRALHPGQVYAMAADVRQAPLITRRRVGECYYSTNNSIMGLTRGD
jgi:hypothetical protein